MKKIVFKDAYSTIGKKENFYRKVDSSTKTAQDEIYSASIVEMAKKFGIDAIIRKAEQTRANIETENELYGIDYTTLMTDRESKLVIKEKLTRIFERIPAKMRKDLFNDNVTKFVDSFASEDVKTLKELNKYGLVSTTQIEAVENRQKQMEKERIRQQDEMIKSYLERNNLKIEGAKINDET